MFIVFEGGDGSGKTTTAKALVSHLESTGVDVVSTREPGGTELGFQLRDLLLHGTHIAPRAEALIFAADRAHHIATKVRPAIKAGKVVVCDRYIDSSVAYQSGGRGLGADDIRSLSMWATQNYLPDLVLVMDIDPALGRERRGSRSADDRMEADMMQHAHTLRRSFLNAAASDPARYVIIDASGAPEDVAATVISAVDEARARHH